MNKDNLNRIMKGSFQTVLILAFCVVKQLMVRHLPIYAGQWPQDDLVMQKMAHYLLSGEWLGQYNYITLVKGIGFPLFLAFTNCIGISYNQASTLFYSISCLAFVYAISPIIKKSYVRIILFAILLFNPISYTFSSIQSVYRTGITPSQVLLAFSGLFAIYVRIDDISRIQMFLWSILCGFGLSWAWITREDSIWILPFVVVGIGVIIYKVQKKIMPVDRKRCFYSIFTLCIPFVFLVGTVNTIKLKNYQMYHTYEINDFNSGSCAELIKKLYEVKPLAGDISETNYQTSVSRETLERVMAVSPTLMSIKPELDHWFYTWSDWDGIPDNGEVENVWFIWMLRDAVNTAGYYASADLADDFYRAVVKEINEAFTKGLLERRTILPAVQMPPFKSSFLSLLPTCMYKATEYMITYQGMGCGLRESRGDADAIAYYEETSKGVAIYPGESDRFLYLNNRIDTLNKMIIAYSYVNYFIMITGLLALVYLIMKLKIEEKKVLITIELGIFLSLLVLLGGIGYKELTVGAGIHEYYLSGGYPLLTILFLLPLCIALENMTLKDK